jgi:LytS/YehU family sensor histidine kinase
VGGDYRLCISVALHSNRIDFHVVNSIPAGNPGADRIDKGIGLENLRRRLQLLYPGRHSLTAERMRDTFDATLSIQL